MVPLWVYPKVPNVVGPATPTEVVLGDAFPILGCEAGWCLQRWVWAEPCGSGQQRSSDRSQGSRAALEWATATLFATSSTSCRVIARVFIAKEQHLHDGAGCYSGG